jgi:hypothetical protein
VDKLRQEAAGGVAAVARELLTELRKALHPLVCHTVVTDASFAMRGDAVLTDIYPAQWNDSAPRSGWIRLDSADAVYSMAFDHLLPRMHY